MSLVERVKSIETPSIRDLKWYYHGIPGNTSVIKNILSEGIKCRNLLGQEGNGYNGKHFISLSKDVGTDESYSIFHEYRQRGINIIIDNIKARRCIEYNLHLPSILANTRFPIRFSVWTDEFQTYKIIEPDKFVGIQFPLYHWVKVFEEEGIHKGDLDAFKNLIIVMKLLEISLPLYDYSRLQSTSIHQINPDEFIAIYDGEIGELTSEEKCILLKK